MRLWQPHSVTTEQLIERYHRPLYWHIRRMVVTHEDAEDVLQETFIQIHTGKYELVKYKKTPLLQRLSKERRCLNNCCERKSDKEKEPKRNYKKKGYIWCYKCTYVAPFVTPLNYFKNFYLCMIPNRG